MREIKFRAFKHGEWFYATLEEICDPLGFEYGIPDNVRGFLGEESKYKSQSTGLKDKNGVEIYESSFILLDGLIAEVKYIAVDGYQGFVGERPNGDSIEISSRCVVIGNIFENPELITNTT